MIRNGSVGPKYTPPESSRWSPLWRYLRAGTSPSRGSLLLCLLVVILCWDTPVVQPLKWLTVLFHELSHAMMGWLTGGQLISLTITNREAGICLVAGGNRTLILLAGYPGSLCWGLAAIYLARRPAWVKPCLYVLSLLLLVITLCFVRPLFGFGALFCALTAIALFALARRAPLGLQQFFIVLVGASSAVYVLVDIQQDVFHRGGGISDATLLAEHTGIPALIWGVVWYVITGGLLYKALYRPTGSTAMH